MSALTARGEDGVDGFRTHHHKVFELVVSVYLLLSDESRQVVQTGHLVELSGQQPILELIEL